MVVGVLRVMLQFDGVRSLKEKRMHMRRVIDRARHSFNAAVSEVGSHDNLDQGEIGVCVASSEQAHANEMVDTIASFIEAEHRVRGRKVEFIHIGEDHGEAQDVVGNWSDFE
jgi:uncharacterized protein YlxP (DUF503 family)